MNLFVFQENLHRLAYCKILVHADIKVQHVLHFNIIQSLEEEEEEGEEEKVMYIRNVMG